MATHGYGLPPLSITALTRLQMSWTGDFNTWFILTPLTFCPAILYQVSQSVRFDRSCLAASANPLFLQGAPILSWVKKGVPNIFMDCHMMVSEPEKASFLTPQ
jgi:hypothetical protein